MSSEGDSTLVEKAAPPLLDTATAPIESPGTAPTEGGSKKKKKKAKTSGTSTPVAADGEESTGEETQPSTPAGEMPPTPVSAGMSASGVLPEVDEKLEAAKQEEPEIPSVVVEKTAENQPSHGDDLGPDATEGQKEAFEMRKADTEPDQVITKSPEPENDEVLVSHEDAKPSDVTEAEAAVVHPKEEEPTFKVDPLPESKPSDDDQLGKMEAAAREQAEIEATAAAEKERIEREEREAKEKAEIEAAREQERLENERIEKERKEEEERLRLEEEKKAEEKRLADEAAALKAQQEEEEKRLKV